MSYLCLKRDIIEGEYGVFEAMGESYIAKKEQGKITVARNACSHRGMRVADCAGKGAIKCKYHGKRFGFEGRVAHYEFDEFIFAPSYLGSSKVLPGISGEIGEEFGRHEQFVKAPFHLWIQNTSDPNHLGYVHKDSFANLFESDKPENVYLSEFESSYTMRVRDDVVERYRKHFKEAIGPTDFHHIIGFPNLSVTRFLGVFYSVESANPVADGCRVVTRFFLRTGLKAPPALIDMALEDNKKVLLEDKEAVERWAIGYKYDPNTQWLPGEERIKRYCDEIRARELE